MLKKIIKILLAIACALLLCIILLLGFLTITEYKPAAQEKVAVSRTGKEKAIAVEQLSADLSILSWNVGYGGLSSGSDFFMDGGSGVRSADEKTVAQNMEAISGLVSSVAPDFCLLQEVDSGSKRSYNIDERAFFDFSDSTYALNFCTRYVPYPIPTIGKVNSGLYTLSDHHMESAERISLPSPFRWPVSTANLKRCLLISRMPIDDHNCELVLVNLHLEAYDNGEGKIAQAAMLRNILEEEYTKGNFVIAGGDFNHSFPGTLEVYPIKDPNTWTPGILDDNFLGEGWQYAFDSSVPSCRLLNMPYDPENPATQYYTIDGFILSPNVELKAVETLGAGFENTDHNPVLLQVALHLPKE